MSRNGQSTGNRGLGRAGFRFNHEAVRGGPYERYMTTPRHVRGPCNLKISGNPTC